MTDTPKIYIACLASYNAGILHGEWIDLAECDDLQDAINNVLKRSPVRDAEEYAIHDYECCGVLSEYSGIDTLQNISEAYEKCESHSLEWEVFCAYCSYRGEDITPDQIRSFEDAYAGYDDNLKTWCERFLEDTGQIESIPENLRFYFDYDAFARDMEIGDVFTIEHNHNVHVFWNH